MTAAGARSVLLPVPIRPWSPKRAYRDRREIQRGRTCYHSRYCIRRHPSRSLADVLTAEKYVNREGIRRIVHLGWWAGSCPFSSDCTYTSDLLYTMVTFGSNGGGVCAGSHRFGSRAEVMHAAMVQRTAHALLSISAMHAYLGRSYAVYWTTFVTHAAWRQHYGPSGQGSTDNCRGVSKFSLPSSLGFWPCYGRLRPAVTPNLQARSDLHLYEPQLRMLPAPFGIAPLTTRLLEYHFCFHNGGGSTRARLDCWAGTDTTMRFDCP